MTLVGADVGCIQAGLTTFAYTIIVADVVAEEFDGIAQACLGGYKVDKVKGVIAIGQRQHIEQGGIAAIAHIRCGDTPVPDASVTAIRPLTAVICIGKG